MTIRASAPGKLMLVGEYTVTLGTSPALAVAVHKRVTVTVEPNTSGSWTVTSPALELVDASPDEVPVVQSALQQVAQTAGDKLTGGSITIASELGAGADKPGLGGSAAICVAVLGALHEIAGLERPTVAECVSAHRDAQDGRGSGYDVATALLGGVVLFEPAEDPTAQPSAKNVEWFDGLHTAVLFTGQGASTKGMLARLQHYRETRPSQSRARFLTMERRAREFVKAWTDKDLEALLDAAAGAQEALVGMDREGRIGIRGGAHAELMGVVEDAGALARTSGAGGGDCLWALATSAAEIDAAVAAAEAMDFTQLSVEFPSEGLLVEVDEGA